MKDYFFRLIGGLLIIASAAFHFAAPAHAAVTNPPFLYAPNTWRALNDFIGGFALYGVEINTPVGNDGKFLRADGTWQTAGGGLDAPIGEIPFSDGAAGLTSTPLLIWDGFEEALRTEFILAPVDQIEISAESPLATDSAGGDILLSSGDGNGTGSGGNIFINPGAGSPNGKAYVNADEIITTANNVTLLTAQNTTSGTLFDCTIPSHAKKINVYLRGVSTSGTSPIIVRVIATSPIISGYSGAASYITTIVSSTNYTAGFGIDAINDGGTTRHGIMSIDLIGSNVWVANSVMSRSDFPSTTIGGGSINAGAQLTGVRLTTINGTDIFDAGTMNCSYH